MEPKVEISTEDPNRVAVYLLADAFFDESLEFWKNSAAAEKTEQVNRLTIIKNTMRSGGVEPEIIKAAAYYAAAKRTILSMAGQSIGGISTDTLDTKLVEVKKEINKVRLPPVVNTRQN